MTLFKNVLVLVFMCGTLFVGAALNHLEVDMVVLIALYLFAAIIAALIYEDFFRKVLKKETRDKQTKEYYGGVAIMIAGVIMYLRFLNASTDKEFYTRLGITFFLACMGIFWEQVVYAASVRTPLERARKIAAKEEARWRAVATMATKAGKEGALRILGDYLRYRVGGDLVTGTIDVKRPIAVYQGKAMTHKELLSAKDDKTGNLKLLTEQMGNYLAVIIKSIPDTGKKE